LQLPSSIKAATRARNPGALIPSSFVTSTLGSPFSGASTTLLGAFSATSSLSCLVNLAGKRPPVYMELKCFPQKPRKTSKKIRKNQETLQGQIDL
jgi:hypothetical protein